MDHSEMVACMQHPAVDLDYAGLAILTGMDRRDVRRLGKSSRYPVPPALADWLRQTIARDPDGEKRTPETFIHWKARHLRWRPPPWLARQHWMPPKQREEDEGAPIPAGEAIVVEDRRPWRR